MTGASKILTVSYGTFSCTLEGFDDPFGTMRSIAEYFRDLAADDRYFGAEPPTPDAAMLARIAERNHRGRIETQVDEDGIRLRQATPDAADPTAGAVPTSPTQPPSAPAAQPQKATAPTAQVAPPAPVADVPPSTAAPVSVADKLSRIRAVVARSNSDFSGYADDDAQFSPATDPTVRPVLVPSPVPVPEPQEQADEAPEPQVEVETADAAEEIASEGQEPDAPDETLAEQPDGATPPADTAETDAQPDNRHDIAEAESASDSADPQDDAANDDLSARIAALSATESDAVQPEVKDEPVVDEDTQDLAPFAGLDDALIDDLPTEALDDAAPDTALDAAEPEEDVSSPEAAIPESLDDSAEDSLVEASPEPIPEPLNPVAEVPASDDTDDETPPVARGDVAVDRILEKTNSELNEHEGSRRRSAIAHLKAAVAATRADGGRTGASGAEDAAMTQYRDDLAKAVRPQRPSADAEKRRDERPNMRSATTPLMLVPSLRVDNAGSDAARGAMAVQPRRVANSDLVYEDDTDEVAPVRPDAGSFAAFAAAQGARELPELMEAAAAFATHVEGRPHVSRPMVMSRVLSQRDGLKREDALRTFGRLLRDGRLIRVKRGRFAVAEDTRFQSSDDS